MAKTTPSTPRKAKKPNGSLLQTRSWYTKKLAVLAKSCAKSRDGHVCQICGKDCYGADCHGSHVEPVGAYKFLELDPNNIKCLCSYCHLRRWHKAPREWGKWFDDKFQERAAYLDMMKKAKLKISTAELATLYDAVRGADWKTYGIKYAELIRRKLI